MFVKFLTSAIRISAIFLFGSTGEIITEKSGHLNLGVPGVMSVGAAVGCLSEYYLIKSIGTSVPFLLVSRTFDRHLPRGGGDGSSV